MAVNVLDIADVGSALAEVIEVRGTLVIPDVDPEVMLVIVLLAVVTLTVVNVSLNDEDVADWVMTWDVAVDVELVLDEVIEVTKTLEIPVTVD